MIILRIIGSLIVIAIGLLLVKYSVRVTDTTGTIEFAEKWLKAPLAGTYTWWKLVGVGIMILGVLWLFGFVDFFPGS
jgi:uncharacterized membrane protein (DUF485 family)